MARTVHWTDDHAIIILFKSPFISGKDKELLYLSPQLIPVGGKYLTTLFDSFNTGVPDRCA